MVFHTITASFFLPRIHWGMKEYVSSKDKQGIINTQGCGFDNKMYHMKASYSLGRNHDLQISFYEHKRSFYHCSQSSHHSQATVESLWLQLPKQQEGQNYTFVPQRMALAKGPKWLLHNFSRIIEQCGLEGTLRITWFNYTSLSSLSFSWGYFISCKWQKLSAIYTGNMKYKHLIIRERLWHKNSPWRKPCHELESSKFSY